MHAYTLFSMKAVVVVFYLALGLPAFHMAASFSLIKSVTTFSLDPLSPCCPDRFGAEAPQTEECEVPSGHVVASQLQPGTGLWDSPLLSSHSRQASS